MPAMTENVVDLNNEILTKIDKNLNDFKIG